MPALAFGDEQTPLADPDIVKAQPEDLAAAQRTEQHSLHHGPVTGGAECIEERVNISGTEHAWQRPRRPDQRDTAATQSGVSSRQPAWHRTVGDPGVASPIR